MRPGRYCLGYTSHGHPIPGRVLHPDRRPLVARCGGPGMCASCSREAAEQRIGGCFTDHGQVEYVGKHRGSEDAS